MVDSRKKIAIEDGTIVNFNREEHRRGKSWVAIVERDMSRPGGLRRSFLARAPGGRVHVEGVEVGHWLEFAGDYYSSRGRRQTDRKYYRVIEINGDLCMEPCESDDIGRQEEAEAVNPLAAYSDDEIRAEAQRRGLTG